MHCPLYTSLIWHVAEVWVFYHAICLLLNNNCYENVKVNLRLFGTRHFRDNLSCRWDTMDGGCPAIVPIIYEIYDWALGKRTYTHDTKQIHWKSPRFYTNESNIDGLWCQPNVVQQWCVWFRPLVLQVSFVFLVVVSFFLNVKIIHHLIIVIIINQ